MSFDVDGRVLDPAFAAVDANAALRRFVLDELTAGHRHWHGLVHHGQLVDAVVTTEPDGAERRLMAWAVLLHDIVYDARRADNEARSAEVAAEWVPAADREAVVALILATEAHRLGVDSPTRRFLLADMAVLWTDDPALYEFYADGIRREYGHVPNADYRAGRVRVLNGLANSLAGELTTDELTALYRNLAWERAERLAA